MLKEILPEHFSRLTFTINGFLYPVPSDGELHEILSTLPDEESLKTFLDVHEITIKGIKRALEDSPNALRILCMLIGQEYASILRFQSICTYYESIFSGKSVNPQKQYRLSLELQQKASNNLDSNTHTRLRNFDGPSIDYEFLIERFPFYEIAFINLESFVQSVFVFSKINPLVREVYLNCLSERKELIYKYSRELEGNLSNIEVSGQCLICQKFISRKRNRGKSEIILCNQASCKAEYNRRQKALERQNSSPNFVAAFDRKRRNCQKCGEKRLVNLNRICKNCLNSNP